jgi:hypothetical protein
MQRLDAGMQANMTPFAPQNAKRAGEIARKDGVSIRVTRKPRTFIRSVTLISCEARTYIFAHSSICQQVQ